MPVITVSDNKNENEIGVGRATPDADSVAVTDKTSEPQTNYETAKPLEWVADSTERGGFSAAFKYDNGIALIYHRSGDTDDTLDEVITNAGTPGQRIYTKDKNNEWYLQGNPPQKMQDALKIDSQNCTFTQVIRKVLDGDGGQQATVRTLITSKLDSLSISRDKQGKFICTAIIETPQALQQKLAAGRSKIEMVHGVARPVIAALNNIHPGLGAFGREVAARELPKLPKVPTLGRTFEVAFEIDAQGAAKLVRKPGSQIDMLLKLQDYQAAEAVSAAQRQPVQAQRRALRQQGRVRR